MRPIKFRAWDKVQDAMVNFDIYNVPPYVGQTHLEGEKFERKYELMQCTGLKDKNGTEIYEGDIVRLQSVDGVDYNAQIVFKDGGFCAIDGAIDNFAVSRYNLTIFDLEITVIGNIYEHYELLERDE